MSKYILLFIILCLVFCIRVYAEPVATTYSNGLKLITLNENQQNKLTIIAVITLSDLIHAKDKQIIGELTTYALFNSSLTASAKGIQREIKSIGGQVQTEWHEDGITISIHTNPAFLTKAMSLLKQALINPVFDGETLNAAIKRFTKQRSQLLSNPYTAAYQEIANHFLRRAPSFDLSDIKPKDLENFHKSAFIANRTTIIVVSPSQLNEVIKKTESHLGMMNANPVSEKHQLQPININNENCRLEFTIPSTLCFIGVPTPGMNHQSYPALLVYNAIIGEGKKSILFNHFRTVLGVGYQVGSKLFCNRDSGLLVLYLQSTKQTLKTTDEAMLLINPEKLQSSDIERGKALVKLSLQVNQLNSHKYAYRIAELIKAGLPADYDGTLLDLIDAVSVKDLTNLYDSMKLSQCTVFVN